MFKRASRPYRTPRIDFGSAESHSSHKNAGRARPIREPLSKDGITFLAQMEGKVALAHTAKGFPHIINRLSPYGYQPSLMIEAIDRLLIDDRPERHGFPFDTVRELGELRELYIRYLSLNP